MSNFQTGFKLGQGIGEAMGPQQSPMVAQIIKQKMASDMRIDEKGMELAANNGLDVKADGTLGPYWKGRPLPFQQLAVQKNWENMKESAFKMLERERGMFTTAETSLKSIIDDPNPVTRQAQLVGLEHFLTKPTLADGSINPMVAVTAAWDDAGLNLREMISKGIKANEVMRTTAVLLNRKMIDQVRAGDIGGALDTHTRLAAMNPKVLEGLPVDLDGGIKGLEENYFSRAEKAVLDSQEKERDAASQDAKDRSVRRLMEANPNMTKAEAINWVEGRTKTAIAQETGDASLIDVGKGTQTPLRTVLPGDDVTDLPEPDPEGPKISEKELSGINLWELAEKGTGLMSSTKAGMSTVSGLARGPIAEETIYARQALTMAQRNLFRALRESSKVLAFEMKTIFEEHPIDPSVWRSPEQARVNFRVIDKFIEERISEAEAKAKDQGVPAKERSEARSLVRSMKDFKRILGVPQQKAPEAGMVENGYKFKGGDPADPNNWEEVSE